MSVAEKIAAENAFDNVPPQRTRLLQFWNQIVGVLSGNSFRITNFGMDILH